MHDPTEVLSEGHSGIVSAREHEAKE
jgi:hypothetical protein